MLRLRILWSDGLPIRQALVQNSDHNTWHINRFAVFIGKALEDATPEDLRSFQLHLVQERKVSCP